MAVVPTTSHQQAILAIGFFLYLPSIVQGESRVSPSVVDMNAWAYNVWGLVDPPVKSLAAMMTGTQVSDDKKIQKDRVRTLERRTRGLRSKCDALSRICGVDVALTIRDGDKISEHKTPPNLDTVVSVVPWTRSLVYQLIVQSLARTRHGSAGQMLD